MRFVRIWALLALLMSVPACGHTAGLPPGVTQHADVIYGRKYGMALTLSVFRPQHQNGAGVILVLSGGWFSAPEMVSLETVSEFLERGYTVFAVAHGSQPKFTIPEIAEDMHRAVRFIRHYAVNVGVDPDKLGITGGSAGGHLSLLMATSGNAGDSSAKDPVERESSRVQAVGCFFPPTDFLNYGEAGRNVFQALQDTLKPFRAPFDFVELDKASGRFLPVTDETRRLAILREISPVTYVSADDPPTLIFHGDKDQLVPLQQSEEMKQALEKAGVPVRLVVVHGADHGWSNMSANVQTIAEWFDTYLLKPATAPQKSGE
ncbi:MAG: alpha/beta hydrolase [Armatimonadetes bacterium]|nr:alpha/beta hydrolase [Armatimonadota bacterium]